MFRPDVTTEADQGVKSKNGDQKYSLSLKKKISVLSFPARDQATRVFHEVNFVFFNVCFTEQ